MKHERTTHSSFAPPNGRRWPFGRAAALSLTLVIGLLVANAWVGYNTIRGLNEKALRVAQSHRVLDAAAGLRDVVHEAVIGATRFVVTGDEDHLLPYDSALAQVKVRMTRLKELTNDNPIQRARAARAEEQVSERLDFAAKIIRARREQGYEAARRLLAKEFKGPSLDDIRAEFAGLTATEQATLGVREQLAADSFRTAIGSTVVVALTGLTLLAVAVWLARRHLLMRQESEALIRESEARFRTVVESVADGIIVFDGRGMVQAFNPAAERLFGYAAHEMLGRDVGALMPKPGGAGGGEDIVGGREVEGRRKDGSTFPMHLSVSEASLGGKQTFIAVTVDMSERKQTEKRLGLLVGELRHRVKNLIAIMQSIMVRTLTDERAMREAREIISGRLLALGRAQDLLIRTSWQGASLKTVVQAELAGFSERISCRGPEVVLNPSATQTFALALHELATNAAKYGALSSPDGRVQVTWCLRDHAEGPRLNFRWLERGGPPAYAPRRKGFGLTMLNEAMMSDFDKPPRMRFAVEGFEYEVDAPFVVLAAREGHDAMSTDADDAGDAGVSPGSTSA